MTKNSDSNTQNTPISASFSHHEIEQKWRDEWQQRNCFNADANASEKPAYCIMIPPPNVTGSLHMGHAFQHSLMDVLVRFKRMQGYNALWQMGTDHAGIATQMVVERKLMESEKLSRHDLGREEFIKRIWQWKEFSGNNISNQIKEMGSSVDWSSERFTMDAGMSEAVQSAFIQLYDEGIIYRGQKLVNWDPKLQTAVSDLEVINKNINELGRKGQLYTIRYQLENSDGFVDIATTRPETLFGDMAIAVHPDDDRYKHLIGKMAIIPVANRSIPIVADEEVEQEFGTGCVKITPAHDFNDYAMGKRHNLTPLNILHPNASLNDNVPTAYQGLDRFLARTKLLEELEALGLLMATADHAMVVPVGDRSNAIIEPYLTKQWFLDAKQLAKDAIELVEQGDIVFIPDNWKNTYFAWMRNIEDWCISRQLWWGHRIVAWYDDGGGVYVGSDEDSVRQKYNLAQDINLKQDEDVLDTWFSSSLWTFATLGWPNKTDKLATFHPTDVLVTGFDIIFFWVARMIMMSKKLTGQIPFKKIYVTGLIRDSEGEKMSKTKGNVIDPLDLINGISLKDLLTKQTESLINKNQASKIVAKLSKTFPEGITASGTDALRFTFCALANSGRDINFDYKRLMGYHHFVNKIWQATKFVLSNCADFSASDFNIKEHRKTTAPVHLWIESRMQLLIQSTTTHTETYRFDLLANGLFDFFWKYYCDWYLEFAKGQLLIDKTATQFTLLSILEQFFRLLNPVMPFVSEELWSKVVVLLPANSQQNAILATSPYPKFDADKLKPKELEAIDTVTNIVAAIRTIRGKHHISPAQSLTIYINDDLQCVNILPYEMLIGKMAKVEVNFNHTDLPPAALELVGNVEVRVPFSDFIDKEQELARLDKQLQKNQQIISQIESKLNNANFVANAPAAVVATQQANLKDLQNKQQAIELQKVEINALDV